MDPEILALIDIATRASHPKVRASAMAVLEERVPKMSIDDYAGYRDWKKMMAEVPPPWLVV